MCSGTRTEMKLGIFGIGILLSLLVPSVQVQADHLDKHITIEVLVEDALPDEIYDISIGIPEAKEVAAGKSLYDNLHNYKDSIIGSDFEIYTYKFSFYDIELGTPYQICIWGSYLSSDIEDQGDCTSGLTTTTDNGHIPIAISAKSIKPIPPTPIPIPTPTPTPTPTNITTAEEQEVVNQFKESVEGFFANPFG
jgi:hypothetical protein